MPVSTPRYQQITRQPGEKMRLGMLAEVHKPSSVRSLSNATNYVSWRTIGAAVVRFLLVWLPGPVCLANPVPEQYQKVEYRIPMRDGVTLYTAVYVPRDASTTKRYPFLMQRSCFGSIPYGPDQYKAALGPSPTLQADGYIFVYQDVRGRWASQGHWTNMTPVISARRKPASAKAVDETTDTYDTIEWLLR